MKQKILIVEDDEPISTSLKELLSETYDIVAVRNAKFAVNYLKDKTVDLIILDLMMPEMTGWDFLMLAEKDEDIKKIPILIMSAWPNAVSDAYMRNFPIVKKPFDADEVEEKIAEILTAKEKKI